MPYKSEAQRRFFNSPAGKKKIGEEEVEEWNEKSKGKKNLPESVKDKLQYAIDQMDPNFTYSYNSLLIEIRKRLEEEYDAINNYMKMLPHTSEEWVKKIIEDIANEEKAHVGELEYILYKLSPEEKKNVDKGKEENMNG
jgi:hypothetical protein|nr:MAG TPA: hypothetical protein [Caudoviricetes sp.]